MGAKETLTAGAKCVRVNTVADRLLQKRCEKEASLSAFAGN